MDTKLRYWLTPWKAHCSALNTVMEIARTNLGDDWFQSHSTGERWQVAECDTLLELVLAPKSLTYSLSKEP